MTPRTTSSKYELIADHDAQTILGPHILLITLAPLPWLSRTTLDLKVPLPDSTGSNCSAPTGRAESHQPVIFILHVTITHQESVVCGP